LRTCRRASGVGRRRRSGPDATSRSAAPRCKDRRPGLHDEVDAFQHRRIGDWIEEDRDDVGTGTCSQLAHRPRTSVRCKRWCMQRSPVRALPRRHTASRSTSTTIRTTTASSSGLSTAPVSPTRCGPQCSSARVSPGTTSANRTMTTGASGTATPDAPGGTARGGDQRWPCDRARNGSGGPDTTRMFRGPVHVAEGRAWTRADSRSAPVEAGGRGSMSRVRVGLSDIPAPRRRLPSASPRRSARRSDARARGSSRG
jgi:hypothetical protein